MNKRAKAVFVLMLVLLVVAMLSACDLKDQIDGLGQNIEPSYNEKHVTVIIGEKAFEIVTSRAYLHELLKDMLSEGKISTYEYGSDGSPYVVAIDTLMQDIDGGKYYSVWHDIDEFTLKCPWSEYVPSRAIKVIDGNGNICVATMLQNKEMFYSGVGIGALPLVEGCTYAILVD